MFVPFFFFFNATATTEIYTLSLHDALPIFSPSEPLPGPATQRGRVFCFCTHDRTSQDAMHVTSSALVLILITTSADRKSTRLNSSHTVISYAVFCLKKKKKKKKKIQK